MTKTTVTASVTLQHLAQQLIAEPIHIAYLPNRLTEARPVTDLLEQLVQEQLLTRWLSVGREGLKLTNGSSFIVTTPIGVRGSSFDLLVSDPDRTFTELEWSHISPLTATTPGARVTIHLDKPGSGLTNPKDHQ